MTEQEFTSLIETYGLEMDNQEIYIFVKLPNRYNKPMQYIEYYKKERWGVLPGTALVYPISPVMSVDGYVLDYEIAGFGGDKKFSKPHKLKRFLDEQMELLKDLKTKILETELSWDFCNDEEKNEIKRFADEMYGVYFTHAEWYKIPHDAFIVIYKIKD